MGVGADVIVGIEVVGSCSGNGSGGSTVAIVDCGIWGYWQCEQLRGRQAQNRQERDKFQDGGFVARRHVCDTTKKTHRVCLLGVRFVCVEVCAGSG